CWDWNVSEMINRKIVDHISDINLPYTEHSRRYLLSEGLDGKTIFVTGSPMAEVLGDHREKINASDILTKLDLEEKRYILISAHREENIDNEENFMDLMNSINYIAEKYQMPVIYSTHPRTKSFIEKRGFKFHPLVQNMQPFGFMDYNKLQMNSYCVLSDSGTLSEESAMLHFPGVLIRTSTERPEVLDKGTVVIGGIKGKDVEQGLELAVSMFENNEKTAMPEDYTDTNVSVKVVKLIQSYAKIVNKTVWLKD
ncbi:MAG: UDP-N-acetylglucosamine 2-epimerase, partial [Clostridiales bacterium]